MKKILFIAVVLFFVVLLLNYPAGAARVEFEHRVKGRISSLELASNIPTLSVDYQTQEGDNKTIKFRFEEATRVVDTDGKEQKREDLKVGDTVEVDYRKKYTGDVFFANIAQTITLQTDKTSTPREDRFLLQGQEPQELYY
jgi:hypothetical protein